MDIALSKRARASRTRVDGRQQKDGLEFGDRSNDRGKFFLMQRIHSSQIRRRPPFSCREMFQGSRKTHSRLLKTLCGIAISDST